MLDLGSDIQDNAELIRGEVGSYRDREFHMTLEHVLFTQECPVTPPPVLITYSINVTLYMNITLFIYFSPLQEQYKFVFEAVLVFLNAFDAYANFLPFLHPRPWPHQTPHHRC